MKKITFSGTPNKPFRGESIVVTSLCPYCGRVLVFDVDTWVHEDPWCDKFRDQDDYEQLAKDFASARDKLKNALKEGERK